MAMTFDSLKFSQRLQQVGVSREQAEAHAELARDMLLGEVATKADLVALKTELKLEIEKGDQRVVIQIGAMLIAAVGVIIAAVRLI